LGVYGVDLDEDITLDAYYFGLDRKQPHSTGVGTNAAHHRCASFLSLRREKRGWDFDYEALGNSEPSFANISA